MDNQNNVVKEVVETNVEGGATKVDATVEVKEEKTFTQAELDKILNKKFAKENRRSESRSRKKS